MESRTLTNTNITDVKENVSDVVIFGDPNTWILVSKASSRKQGFMKSTKAMCLYRIGILVQTETMETNPDGTRSVSQSLQLVPEACLVFDGKTDSYHIQKATDIKFVGDVHTINVD